MAARRKTAGDAAPNAMLEELAQQALHYARKAKKHKQSLTGDSFYGNKLAVLRADATNAFNDLSSQSAGNTTALAELIAAVFSSVTKIPDRIAAARELVFALRTTWKQKKPSAPVLNDEGLFPQSILEQTKRGYIISVGRQMNGCHDNGWYDACAVMMRRLIEIVIIEAFEHKRIAAKIKGADGNYLHLSDLVALSIKENAFTLSRNARQLLPHLRDVGHMSAHSRYYHARKEDVERLRAGCRVVVEEFLHHAGLI